MRRLPSALAILLLASLPSAAGALNLVVDDWTASLPPSPCLPASQQPVIFTGSYCDGYSCPPGAWVSSDVGECNDVVQPVSPGGFAPLRECFLGNSVGDPGYSAARIDPVNHRLEISTTAYWGATFQLSYFGPYADPPSWWLDLTTAVAFRFSFHGEITPSRPVYLRVLLSSGSNPGDQAVRYLPVTSTGELVVPIGSLVPGSSFDITRVTMILIDLEDCGFPYEACVGGEPPRTYSTGPIVLEMDAGTPVRMTSWGGVKTIYR